MFNSHTRGVSEVVGFILTFSLVLGSVTFVYVGGFAELSDTRDAEQVNNAERAFDVLANNLEQVARQDAPSRATEIKLAGAQLEFGPERQFVVNDTRPEGGFGTSGGHRAIKYSTPGTDTEIVYEAGAVIRSDPSGAVMIREPDFVLSDHATIRFIAVTPRGPTAVSGDRTVLVRSLQQSSSHRYHEDDSNIVGNDVEIYIETAPDRAEVWEDYFRDNGLGGCGPDTEFSNSETTRIVCDDLPFESVSVTRSKIRSEFI